MTLTINTLDSKETRLEELGETGIALNRLAREQMKLRLMQDIRIDITVCQQEGIDYKPYLKELKGLIDGFLGVKND